jgi:hypothetical protein
MSCAATANVAGGVAAGAAMAMSLHTGNLACAYQTLATIGIKDEYVRAILLYMRPVQTQTS